MALIQVPSNREEVPGEVSNGCHADPNILELFGYSDVSTHSGFPLNLSAGVGLFFVKLEVGINGTD